MVAVAVDRQLRQSFDGAADIYDAARPEYPPELFGDLIDLADLGSGASLLEVGCGTGKATRPLAERGFRIVALELGDNLARVARRNLAGFPEVSVVNTAFEDWDPGDARFDLVFAATSWRWIDPAVRYQRAAAALRNTGALAFWSAEHAFPRDFDPFFIEIQAVYEGIGEDKLPWPPQRPDQVPDQVPEIEASGLFERPQVRRYVWERTYSADEYVALLDTFSGHRVMEPDAREHLDSEVRRRIAARDDQRIRRQWHAILHLARRLDDSVGEESAIGS
jgi:SAM-dependent methyltransferase